MTGGLCLVLIVNNRKELVMSKYRERKRSFVEELLKAYFITRLTEIGQEVQRVAFWPLQTLFIPYLNFGLFLAFKVKIISEDGVINIGSNNDPRMLKTNIIPAIECNVNIGDCFIFYPPTKALFLIPAKKAKVMLKQPEKK